jgi:pyrroloquinoline-quinone synthase
MLSEQELVGRLREVGTERYHDQHPFHLRMHAGELSPAELRAWVENRFYYQTRIPIKDALIVAKSDEPSFRRAWLRRIVDHDGAEPGTGGLELWLRLGEGVGLSRSRLLEHDGVLPGVRFACDAYVSLVQQSSLVVAVASSLTEFFAPDLMSRRIAAFEQHYRFIDPAALEYFRQRVPRARRDSDEAIRFVLQHARSQELQDACVQALVRKTEILWHLLDCVQQHCTSAGRERD